jgi:hypothetical protein
VAKRFSAAAINQAKPPSQVPGAAAAMVLYKPAVWKNRKTAANSRSAFFVIIDQNKKTMATLNRHLDGQLDAMVDFAYKGGYSIVTTPVSMS